MTDQTILIFALMGAMQSGSVHGRNDTKAGNKFRGAFAAADEVGLTDQEHLKPLRNVFVHGYLESLPVGGVTVDENGLVVTEKPEPESRSAWLSKYPELRLPEKSEENQD